MAKVDISVGNLVDMIARGELRLPELQRQYVWPATRVRDLLDSLYRGYPSGTILVWETDEDVPAKDMAVVQEASAFRTSKLLLDGQQRLTSLFAMVRGQPLKIRRRVRPIEIAFNVDHPEGPPAEVTEVEDDEPQVADDTENDESDDSTAPTVHERIRRRTFVVASRSVLSDAKWIRVSDIFDPTKTDWQLLKPLSLSPDDPDYDRYSRRLQQVRGIRNYQYVMQVLERNLPYEEVAEIFVRVNSLGMKLRGSDLALAQITARWPHSLQLFEGFAEELETAWPLDLGLVVRTLVVFATHQSRFRTVGTIPVDKLRDSWEQTKIGLRFAVNFLKANAGVEAPSLLSSPFLLVPIAVYAVKAGLQVSAQVERQFLQWLFLANAQGHYSASSETILDADLSLLFRDEGPSRLIEVLQQQFGRTRFQASDFVRRGGRNPLFQTTYLALRHAGATDWATGLKISLNHVGRGHALEAHHIFPKSVLKQHGYEQDEINEIANLAFLSGAKNRTLASKTPDSYFPRVIEHRGKDALLAQGIPPAEDLWRVENYRQFLEYRRKKLAEAVNSFLDVVAAEGGTATFDVGSIVSDGENSLVEFKETLRYNSHTKQADTVLEAVVAKAVAGFLNSQGGTLVIGVDDSGVLLGIGRDLTTLGKRQNVDGFQQSLRQVIREDLGPNALSYVEVLFPWVDGVQVCAVRVAQSPVPVYAKQNSVQGFYVRMGNTTQPLNMQQAHEYIGQHFK